MASVSPTCLRSETSRSLSRFFMYLSDDGSVNPWDAVPGLPLPLMTAGCYCRGSDELDNLLRCR